MAIILRRNGGRGGLAPFYRTGAFLDEIDRMRRDFWSDWGPSVAEADLMPQTDIYEENGELVVKAELPGIKKDDIEVTLDEDVLTIKAEKKEEVAEDATRHTSERRYGKYVRSVQLPYKVDGGKIEANLADGVLQLNLPRAEETKAKRIDIREEAPKLETDEKKSEAAE